MARKSKKTETLPIEKTNIYGWLNSEDVARSVWSSNASIILKGQLVFAFKGDTDKGPIQVVVVKNSSSDWGLMHITPGWSCIIPHTSKEYLENITLKDLDSAGVNSIIIESYLDQIKTFSEIKNGN